ncbi:hypothetical protein [Sorangium sp. So ce341]|uniref:hypothetical protein n=1 Tax=Sorangium sp. So ce341 TaxID=3133302 RepID=UPI003F644AE1
MADPMLGQPMSLPTAHHFIKWLPRVVRRRRAASASSAGRAGDPTHVAADDPAHVDGTAADR